MTTEFEKRHILRLFVAGHTAGEVAELLNRPSGNAASPVNTPDVEKLFEECLAMPMSEKQQALLAEQISCHMYRLMDSVADLKRVDALLSEAGAKMIIPLLGIKQKIREQMAKEDTPRVDKNSSTEQSQEHTEGIVDEYYNRVFKKSQNEETEN
ncbi:hypothetical protein HZA56_21420 [Candidatus Poribacteria bacterium]|nr:hypothetical protein [Candidatus Poribacteria bacterium]